MDDLTYSDMLGMMRTVDDGIDDAIEYLSEDVGDLATDFHLANLLNTLAIASDAVIRRLRNGMES